MMRGRFRDDRGPGPLLATTVDPLEIAALGVADGC